MKAMLNRCQVFAMISAFWLFHFLITLAVFSQSRAYTWFEAQIKCREKNQTLTLWNKESATFYWTGFYKKRSQWIKIMGCYPTLEIQKYINKSFDLSKSSPPLCQEHCLQENIYLFALRAEQCICLSHSFDNFQNQIGPSNCTYRCNESRLLSNECGGESAFNVFLTDTANLNVTSRCLSIQCGADPSFQDTACKDWLPTICNKVIDTTNGFWKIKKEYCKEQGFYPIGNITLSNKRMACMESMQNESSPRWVGIVQDFYQKEEQGKLILESEKKSIKKCMICRSNDNNKGSECQYKPCSNNIDNEVYCSKEEDSTTTLPENKDTSYTTRISSSVFETTSIVSVHSEIFGSKVSGTTSIVSSELEKTGGKESASVIVPVIIVILVLSVCAVAIVLYIRKKKRLNAKDAHGGEKTQAVESTNYSNVENHTDNNYFVLQKSNPSYELAGNDIVKSESPYIESEDGTYDHLGNKDARKKPAEDIYNHTSGLKLPDLSDYDVTNHKYLNEEDSTYDHAGDVDNSYGHFNLHQIKDTDYSEFS